MKNLSGIVGCFLLILLIHSCCKKDPKEEDYKELKWTNYTTADGLATGEVVSAIAIDAQDNKWFGTWRRSFKI